MRTFEIVSSHGRRKFPVGWLYYEAESSTATIRIAETAEVGHVPAMFDYFIEQGKRELDASWTLKWVQERVPPSDRHNIRVILDSLGIDEYDPYPLLLASEGRSPQDDFYLREMASSSYDYAIVSLQEEVGGRVAQARKDSGLTQQELAYRSGVQQSMLSKLENGKVNPTLETLACIAEAAGMRLDITFTPLE